jgi:hypothetical protein
MKDNQPQVVLLRESMLSSVLSDMTTFIVVGGLVLLADGRSMAWQVITIGMFLFYLNIKLFFGSKIKKFYNRRELLEWANSLPDDTKENT